jgi:hypothetical protein
MKISKKEIKDTVSNAMQQTLFDLQIAPSRKIKKMIADASKKFSGAIKRELKKQAVKAKAVKKKSVAPKVKRRKPRAV